MAFNEEELEAGKGAKYRSTILFYSTLKILIFKQTKKF